MVIPAKHPKMMILVGKPMIVGYHHETPTWMNQLKITYLLIREIYIHPEKGCFLFKKRLFFFCHVSFGGWTNLGKIQGNSQLAHPWKRSITVVWIVWCYVFPLWYLHLSFFHWLSMYIIYIYVSANKYCIHIYVLDVKNLRMVLSVEKEGSVLRFYSEGVYCFCSSLMRYSKR